MSYTSHGHHVSGTVLNEEERPSEVARCGGPGLCDQCSREASAMQRVLLEEVKMGADEKVSSGKSSPVQRANREFSVNSALKLLPGNINELISDAEVIEAYVQDGTVPDTVADESDVRELLFSTIADSVLVNKVMDAFQDAGFTIHKEN